MEIYDTILLLLVLAAAFLGWRKGLATQVASIASIVASYLVAANFHPALAEMINAVPPWNTFAAMLILYLGTSLAIWLVFRQVRSSIEAMKLREFDRQMGALFGAAKGFILACIITLFGVTLLHEDQRQTIVQSKSGYVIARFLNGAVPMMPLEVRNFLGPYLDQLDEQLELEPWGLQADQQSPGPSTGSAGYPPFEDPVYPDPVYPDPVYPDPVYPASPPYSDSWPQHPAPTYVPPGAWPSNPDWRATTPSDDQRY